MEIGDRVTKTIACGCPALRFVPFVPFELFSPFALFIRFSPLFRAIRCVADAPYFAPFSVSDYKFQPLNSLSRKLLHSGIFSAGGFWLAHSTIHSSIRRRRLARLSTAL